MAEIIQRELIENGEVVGYEYGGRLVRCKDCEEYLPYKNLPSGKSKWCDLLDRATPEMNYCGWGKRREDAVNKEFTLYADDKPIVTFKASKIVLHGERKEDEADRRR